MRLMTRTGIAASLLLVSFLAWAAARPSSTAPKAPATTVAAELAKKAPSSGGWPETKAGAVARRWVDAFNSGDDAMRACIQDITAPESLAKRGVGERLITYHAFRERMGTLSLASIEHSAPSQIEVVLLASDLSRHPFTFTVQNEAPYRLVSITMKERSHSMGAFGFHH
jgi:hypothetical protein